MLKYSVCKLDLGGLDWAYEMPDQCFPPDVYSTLASFPQPRLISQLRILHRHFILHFHFFFFTGSGTSQTAHSSHTLKCRTLLHGVGQHLLGPELSQSEPLGNTTGPREKGRLRRRTEQHSAHRDDTHTELAT